MIVIDNLNLAPIPLQPDAEEIGEQLENPKIRKPKNRKLLN